MTSRVHLPLTIDLVVRNFATVALRVDVELGLTSHLGFRQALAVDAHAAARVDDVLGNGVS